MPQIWTVLFRVILLWSAGLGAAAQFAKVAIPFDQVQAAYPGIGTEIGWLLSLISLLGAVLGVVAGDLVGRFGARRLLILGMVIGGVISFWQALFPAFSIMLFSRLLEGMSHLIIVVAAPTLIVHASTPRTIGPAMTLWSTFFGVSFTLVAWVVVPLIGSDGIVSLFVGHGLYMLAVGALIALTIPQEQTDSQDAAAQGIFAASMRAYSSASIAAPAAGWLFYTLTFVALLALLPAMLPTDAAVWAAGLLPVLSIAVSLLVVPLLLGRVSSIAIVIFGFALSFVLVLMELALGLNLVFLICLFSALGLVQAGSFAAIPDLATSPQDQAMAYGLMAQSGNCGNLLGTPLLLAVLGSQGLNGMYAVVAALYAAAILTHLYLAQRRRLHPGGSRSP